MAALVRKGLEEERPHVLVLLETKLGKRDATPKFPGYEAHRVDRPERGEEGGALAQCGHAALRLLLRVIWAFTV